MFIDRTPRAKTNAGKMSFLRPADFCLVKFKDVANAVSMTSFCLEKLNLGVFCCFFLGFFCAMAFRVTACVLRVLKDSIFNSRPGFYSQRGGFPVICLG